MKSIIFPSVIMVVGIFLSSACNRAPHGQIVELNSTNTEHLWVVKPTIETNMIAASQISQTNAQPGAVINEAAGANIAK